MYPSWISFNVCAVGQTDKQDICNKYSLIENCACIQYRKYRIIFRSFYCFSTRFAYVFVLLGFILAAEIRCAAVYDS